MSGQAASVQSKGQEGPAASTNCNANPSALRLRQAVQSDIEELQSMIALSVRELQKMDYSPEQLATAVGTVFALDEQLVSDGTYFVIDGPRDDRKGCSSIVACGGWSARRTLCGGHSRDNAFLDPKKDAAKIRQFFVHPAWARRGLGSRLLAHSEQAAQAAGFCRFEMAATLTGVPLYQARGYRIVERAEIPLQGSKLEAAGSCASNFAVVIMERSIADLSFQ